MDLKLDFWSDWIALLRPELARMGYTVPANTDAREVALLYFNALFRRIPKTPRKVRKSLELQCPAKLQSGLKWLENKVTCGGDLNPHLSRKSPILDYDDALLNDWGIFHFHLDRRYITEGKRKGLVGGTDPVLLARVTDTEFYAVCTGIHQNGWADLNWIGILHSNWPEAIERFKVPQAKSLTRVVDTATVRALRAGQGGKAGKVNSLIRTRDGTIYRPFGGGYTRDGRSIVVVMTVNQRVAELRHLEKFVRKNTAMFLDDLKKLGYSESKPLKGDFVVNDNGWYVFFPDWDYAVRLRATTTRTL